MTLSIESHCKFANMLVSWQVRDRSAELLSWVYHLAVPGMWLRVEGRLSEALVYHLLVFKLSTGSRELPLR